MLDFTITPERRKRAGRARTRKAPYLMGIAFAAPAAARAIYPDMLRAPMNRAAEGAFRIPHPSAP